MLAAEPALRLYGAQMATRVLPVSAVCLALALGAGPTRAADDASAGRAILAANCGRCHAIDATGASPLAQAPPLREVYLKYPIDQLEEGFAEGMGSRHREMPQIQFSDEQVAAILNYLGGITGVDPATRPHVAIPGETPP
jgi:mono/diheme cytochrome c family protein